MSESNNSVTTNIFTLKRIIIIAVSVFCLIAFFLCLFLSSSIRTSLRSQQAANAWAGQSGERFSQLSVFFPESGSFNEDDIRRLYTILDNDLRAASMESAEDRTLYTDAWSTSGDVSLSSLRGSVSAKAIAVGGDFFVFHPLALRDGSYLSPNDVMKDRVVLDEDLAWRLFGAVRVSGFNVLINNRTFVVAGVIARESDFATRTAYTDGAGLFMTYDAFKDMAGDIAGISCYEIVLPDPISGFAKSTLTGAITDPGAFIVENSTRFSLGNIFAVFRSFGERSMRTTAIVYPYWENAARFAEDWLALLLVISIIFIIFPVVCFIIYGVILIRLLIKLGKNLISGLIAKKDKRAYEKYLLEHHEEPQIYNVDDIIREVHDEIY